MKKIFENWKKYINESEVADLYDDLADAERKEQEEKEKEKEEQEKRDEEQDKAMKDASREEAYNQMTSK